MMSSEPVVAGAASGSDIGTPPPSDSAPCSEVDLATDGVKVTGLAFEANTEVAPDPVRAPEDLGGNMAQKTYSSVILMPQWDIKPGGSMFHNLTPWVTSVFFVHTYYCYLYSFFLIVFSYYKSYALEHPEWRKWLEIMLLISLPALQHMRFFFGYWACQLGFPVDLAIFLSLCPVVMSLLMYFRFDQMYILPLESTLLFIALWVIALEAFSGAINALQVLKITPLPFWQRMAVGLSILCSLAAVCILLLLELTPQMSPSDLPVDADGTHMSPQQRAYWDWMYQHFPGVASH